MPIHHHNGDPGGTALCDSLLLALKTLDPSVDRHEAPSTCSFRAERHASFAFVYHYKTDPHLKIYFRATSAGRPDEPPDAPITRRKSVDSDWAKLFPESLRLDTQAQIESVADFLFDNSYQLAEVRRRSKRGDQRPAHLPDRFADQFSAPQELPPERRPATGQVFPRSAEVRRRIRELSHGKCEWCGEVGFEMLGGKVYIETHHVIALADGGLDNEGNVVALCPKHHREAHYGANSFLIRRTLLDRLAHDTERSLCSRRLRRR
jgi:hypothetical protein